MALHLGEGHFHGGVNGHERREHSNGGEIDE
jgi:hypothetical protein